MLFCIFGWFVVDRSGSLMEAFIGWLIIAHGLGTLVAGFFPMDADSYTETPTTSCNIHTAAGVVMLLSLILAPGFTFFIEVPDAFKYFTGACLITFVIFMMLVGFFVNAMYSILFSIDGVMKGYRKVGHWVERAVSGLFAAAGLSLLWSAFNRNPA